MKKILTLANLLTALILLGVSCQPGETDKPIAAPTWEELANATYHGLDGPDEPITLVDGRWEGEPFAEGGAVRPSVLLVSELWLTGDLDGDGAREAVVFLNEITGGSGELLHLVVVGRAGPGVEQKASTLVGDRVQVREAGIEGDRISLDVVRAGPGDAMCCPGELASLAWRYEPVSGLRPVAATGAPRRMSLETIGGAEWILSSWAWEEPAPAEPRVTLNLADGEFVGHSGCNRYVAAVAEGESPGELSVSPAGATRMACPDAEMAVETRFLAQLAAVRKYGFQMGRLALSYEKEGQWGVMLFEAASSNQDH